MQDYLACAGGVDESVGKLLDWLDRNGLADNTIVIYTSDQGFFLGDPPACTTSDSCMKNRTACRLSFAGRA